MFMKLQTTNNFKKYKTHFDDEFDLAYAGNIKTRSTDDGENEREIDKNL